MSGWEPVDLVVGAILLVTTLRGLFLGLVREAFSLSAVGGAYIAVRLFTRPAAQALLDASGLEIDPRLAPWIAGAAIAGLTLAAVVIAGRLVARGIHAVGLGWADRLGGGLLGATEGVLVTALLLLLAGHVLGRAHPVLADSRSLAAFEQLERIAQHVPEVDVAAPPGSRAP